MDVQMLSIAMLSKWHVHAERYAEQAFHHPQLKVTAVWDEDPNRGSAWAQTLGVPFVSDLAGVLEDPTIDGVIVDAPTNLHDEIIIAAARAGKHIFSEKVLSLTTKGCDTILSVVNQAGVQLMLSLPRLTRGPYLYAQRILDEGRLGRLTSLRCRLTHGDGIPSANCPYGGLPDYFYDPAQCGGGALIDLGAHPIYLANRLAGAPKAVMARLTSFIGWPVDDNSVVIAEYELGVIGVLEAGFVSGCSPFLLELHGTEGALLVEDNQVRIRLKSNGRRWEAVNDLPMVPDPMQQWVAAILGEAEPTIRHHDMRMLTQFHEAAALSHREARRVLIEG